MDKIFSDIEQELFLIGATVVEDRLQDRVPETIAELQQANIKIWMLTGDKLETAENIGYSCNLFTQEMDMIKCTNYEDVMNEFTHEKIELNTNLIKKGVKRGMLIEQGALKYILADNTFVLRNNFLKIAKTVTAVVCCRVSPAQKAEVVRLIKEDDDHLVTLAVGDGANDVSMILEAHIGIGLYGHEGMRAV